MRVCARCQAISRVNAGGWPFEGDKDRQGRKLEELVSLCGTK